MRTIKLMRLALLFLLAVFAGTAGGKVVEIADGDVNRFLRTLCETQFERETTIVLAPDGDYRFETLTQGVAKPSGAVTCASLPTNLTGSLDTVFQELTILGRGSRISGLTLEVLPDAKLRIHDLNFDLSNNRRPAIINEGISTISRSSFSDADLRNPTDVLSTVATNTGIMKLANVSIFSNHAAFESCPEGFSTIHNQGTLDLFHVTLGGNRLVGCEASNIYNAGDVTYRNSVIFALPSTPSCAGPGLTLSGGNNFLGAEPCSPDAATSDFFSADGTEGLRTFIFGRFGIGIGFPEERRATLSIDRSLCSEEDQFASPRGLISCGAGAIEGGAPTPIVPNTLTGLWYQPEADGQYLQFIFTEPGRVLLTWQTFDQDGNNLWLYGIGQPAQNRVALPLFRNAGLVFSNGEFEGSVSAFQVGSASFRLISCNEAELTFSAGVATRTSRYQRLAFAEGLNCTDPATR